MAEPAILIRVRPGLYRAHSRTSPGLTYKINVTLVPRWGWSAVCDCPGSISIHNKACKHAREAAQKEYEHMVTQQREQQERGVVVYERLPMPTLDPGTVVESMLLPAPSEIAAMVSISNLMTPDDEDPRETFKKALAGWELGVGTMTAIRHMFNVNNKIEPDTQLMLALAIAGDESLSASAKGDATKCTVTLRRNGKDRDPITYTIEDANRSGQTKKKRRYNKWYRAPGAGPDSRPTPRWEDVDGPWQLYPADMLRHAAMKRALRLYAPDLINNVKGVTRMGRAENMVAIDAAVEPRDADELQRQYNASDVNDTLPPHQHYEGEDIDAALDRHDPDPPPAREEAPQRYDAPDRVDVEQHHAFEKTEAEPEDVTNYRAVVTALMEEVNATADGEFIVDLNREFVDKYKYAIVVTRNIPRLVEAKLTQTDAKEIAATIQRRLYGTPPEAVAVGAGEPEPGSSA